MLVANTGGYTDLCTLRANGRDEGQTIQSQRSARRQAFCFASRGRKPVPGCVLLCVPAQCNLLLNAHRNGSPDAMQFGLDRNFPYIGYGMAATGCDY